MKTSQIFMAAIAATLLSTAAMASPPPAQDVTVPQGAMDKPERAHALFGSPEARMMFKMQMHEATRGMTHEQKKAYQKDQKQKIKAMTGPEKEAWRRDLETKWAALDPNTKARISEKMEKHEEKHQARKSGGAGPDADDDMGGPPPPPPSK
jgi:hypothetical protein